MVESNKAAGSSPLSPPVVKSEGSYSSQSTSSSPQTATFTAAIIISTYPDEQSILNLARELVANKKICACVNFFPVRSLYQWKEKIEDQNEFLAIFKTSRLLANAVKFEIKKSHPYEVPEIMELSISDISQDYLSWIISITNSDANSNIDSIKEKDYQ